MSADRPGLGPILLTVFLDLLGFGLVIPLLGYYVESFGATPSQVTWVMASYSIAQFLGAPLWGALSDRWGRRPVLLVSIGASALFLAAFASATSLATALIARSLHGLCAANIGTAQAYVADVTSGKERAKGMGMIGAAFGVGFTVGPLVGGWLSRWGIAAPIWLAASLSVINLVWVWLRLPESRPPGSGAPSGGHGRTLDPRALAAGLRHPVVGGAILLTFVATFAFAMMESVFQLVAEHVWGMADPADVGTLFGLIGMIAILIQGGLIRRLVPRFGEARLVAAGYLVNGAGMFTLASVPAAWSWLAVGCALMAVGSSLANPSLSSLISRATPEDEQGSILGINQSFAALARATAPLAGGYLYEGIQPTAPFYVGGALLWVALLMAIPATRAAMAVERT